MSTFKDGLSIFSSYFKENAEQMMSWSVLWWHRIRIEPRKSFFIALSFDSSIVKLNTGIDELRCKYIQRLKLYLIKSINDTISRFMACPRLSRLQRSTP